MVVRRAADTSLMDVSKIFSLLQPKEEGEGGGECEALNEAVGRDDAALLSELLSQESYAASINARSGWGVPVTPLRTAAARGHLRCLELLLQRGAEIDSLDVKAQTPLFAAVSGKHLDCVVALLKAGADPNGSRYNGCSPVLTAAREGDVDVLRELLRFGAEADVRPKVPEWASGASACRGPLYLAAVYGHLDCFRLLLLHGANPNYNCTDGKALGRMKQPKTVLEVCLRYGCGAEYVQLLVDFGADVYLPTLIIDKTTKQNEALLLLLRERVRPKTLMSQTRLAIRRHILSANKAAAVDSLDVPALLRNYLKHEAAGLV
ncbi:ankyrin repeat and SOCS box protein 12b [Betta splendens]|uniref:Ankyrin repeat and SOCS box protein 12 n=1 Tax=Betta splendens TaxID=158456 RepID=A0A6P7NTW1_BETSP|nr:ankyrin repeat and SOCS box protein 12b [Betta splendens]XP_055368175.1 ankyrin repeat and SOCS box protein 12b [Betta splendens]XP_055368176.1 ankyrin repeat and SOCS box protein 12b [Betta splendens]